MLSWIWQWLKRFFQRLFGSKHPSRQLRRHTVEPPKQLTNAEYEALFLQLLAGVDEGWSRGRVKGFLDANKITQAGLVQWLRRFGERLLVSSAEDTELDSPMVRLGELGVGEVGEVAGEIGMRLLGRGGETNHEGAKDAKEGEEEDAEAWFDRGIEQAMAGNFEGAIASFDKALEVKPDIHQAWYNRGLALGNLGRFEEAIASYDKALEIKSNDHQAWYNRGMVLSKLGQIKEAIISFHKALLIKPDKHEAWNEQGVALGKLGQIEEAIISFDKSLEIKPKDDQAWYNRGVALDNLGRSEQAIASYDKAIEFKLDYHEAWYNRGVALDNLGQIEEAIASYDKAVEIKPDKHEAWNNRGVALRKLGQIEEAIASYDKAVEIKPDYHDAWNNRGWALGNLGRSEQAIASYDRAIEIKLDKHEAWNNRGVALNNLGRSEQAIASYDKALLIKPDKHEPWLNRGNAAGNSVSCDLLLAFMSAIARQNPHLNQRGYDGRLASYEEGLKYCHQHTHPEGWGKLHQAMGNAHYFRGRGDSRPRSYWHKAVNSYNKALKTLTEADFPELHLEVLQNLIRVLLDLGETAKAQELQRRGTDLLRRLLDECKSPEKEKQLALKFAGFQQLTVDLAVQSGEVLQALELAEQGKNVCLAWLLDAESDESPAWEEMKQLLNPTTAIVYWHLSPAALHTFILKHDASSPILISPPTLVSGVGGDFQSDELEVPAAVRRLHEFENWVKEWNEQYASYCQGRDKQAEEENNWRDNLPQMLSSLANILDISAIVTAINPESIQNLILIPHRDLHRFPLHALFPDNFTITYLPSAQIGLSLMEVGSRRNIQPTKFLLSVEAPDSQYAEEKQLPPLLDAEIESCVITQWFANCRRFPGDTATKAKVTDELTSGYSYFHFTGHGTYNFYNPKESALALSGRDTLTLEDICQFNLSHYELVSLCACETAVTGNQTISTEYVGLVSGFVRQGVAHVVSTLWRVESVSSALFMMEFYRQLNRDIEPTTALRQTQIWLATVKYSELVQWYKDIAAEIAQSDSLCAEDLKDKAKIIEYDVEKINSFVPFGCVQGKPPYAHPYFWASFIITGTVSGLTH